MPGVTLGGWPNLDRAYNVSSIDAEAGPGDKADPGVMRKGTVNNERAAVATHVDCVAATTENEKGVQA
ncbi:MAG TPA: hypothetical protein VE177_02340 [Candidatus Binatus sp.]|nr:hypothetical protein [Candidatus Binatus sp.]